jgi:ABC-2 type transport system permease protein
MFILSTEKKRMIQVFLRLVQRDIYVNLPLLPSRIISVVWWSVIYIYMFEYVGIGSYVGWGLFIAASECASRGFKRFFPALRIAVDLQGDRSLFYYLTLPVPQWMVFAALAFSVSIELMAIYIWVLPVAKLVLWKSFHLSLLGCIKVACIFICAHLFYGAWIILIASSSFASVEDLSVKHYHYVEPFFWTGGYYFTWHLLYTKSYFFGSILLANPLIYATEGMRSALFNNPESLSVWLCCMMLLAFTAVTGTLGIQRMMKKVDCVY